MISQGLFYRAAMLVALMIVTSNAQQGDKQKPAVALEPIKAILEAFRAHALVGLGDPHGNEQISAFRISLIRDPRFAGTVNDIVVEFGNSRYQDVIDRFVRGEEVPYELLRQVWQNTTQVEYGWDLPIYEDFFRAVREVNASIPPSRQLRILLGDPPIDWKHVHGIEDLQKWLNRDEHLAEVIRREVLNKNRHALVIYGDAHLLKSGGMFAIHPETRLDLTALQLDIGSWPRPSLTMIQDTSLGFANYGSKHMQDLFDAVLYLGPPSAMTMSRLSPRLCSDRGYMEMRLGRLALLPTPPGVLSTASERLKGYCANPNGTAIDDTEPKITGRIRQMLVNAAAGTVDPEDIAPESRSQLLPFLQNSGPRFLSPLGPIGSLTLLSDRQEGPKRVRAYRAVFASGKRILLNVGFTSAGTIITFDALPE